MSKEAKTPIGLSVKIMTMVKMVMTTNILTVMRRRREGWLSKESKEYQFS